MKTTAIAIVVAGLFVAGAAAAASDQVSDMDYMKASRCKGLAAGLGSDTAGLDAFLKAQSRWRSPMVLDRGDKEMTRAKREAAKTDLKDRMAAELSGPCMAYTSDVKAVAAAR